MAVFELEQRYVPLIECQHVWQPWGVAGRYCLDEEDSVSESSSCGSSVRRAHSWGGYTSYSMRRRFSNPEDMVDGMDQFKAVEDEQINQSWSKPAVEAKSVHFSAFTSQSTSFSSEDSSPCFSSEGASNCFSSEASSAFFSSEASGTSFSSEASSRPQKQRRTRRSAATRQTTTTTGSFASVMMAKEKEGGSGGPEITTLMVQNVPYNLSREELLAEVERDGFPAGENGYNFCHLPRIFKTGKNQGFAFLNFASQAVAERFASQWHNSHSLLQGNLQRALRVKVAAMQGIEACEEFSQSKKMQRVKTGTFKPLIVMAAQAVTDTDAMAPSC